MYVDHSRIEDLQHLQAALDDSEVPEMDKLRAFNSKQKILRELNDPVLGSMRESLVKMVEAGDKREIWKQSMRIKEYLHEEQLEEGTMT